MNNESNRLKNSKLNVSSNLVLYITQSLLSFAVRTIFIRKLGAELIGLDSLLLNILTMLSIAELGFSTAISYGLYKPLANKDVKKINAYMSFYKRTYRYIGIFIFIFGFIVSLFLNRIVGDYDYKYIFLVYFLYLFNTGFQYFLSYKEVLLVSDQKNYKIFKYNFITTSLMYILQFILLYFYPNYVIYILITIVFRIIYRFVSNRFISKYYNNIDFNSEENLDESDKQKLKENIFGLLCYKIGDYTINSTDNIVISAIINIKTVGLYTNYLSIITVLKTIIKNIFNGITASFGNLATIGDKELEKDVFNKMVYIGFFISGYVSICLIFLLNPLVNIWLGKKFVLSSISVSLICINFYLACNQMPLDTIKESKGFYKKDRYLPIFQAIINIVVSVIFAYKYKLNGVLLGTLVSYVSTVMWYKPYLLNKYIFNINSIKYFFDQIKYFISLIIIYTITYFVLNSLSLSSNIVGLILSGIIITIVYVTLTYILYFNNNEFNYFKNMALNIFKFDQNKR